MISLAASVQPSGMVVSDSISFTILQSPLVCQILGGNRTVSSTSALNLTANINDPDAYADANPLNGMNIIWSCSVPENGGATCVGANNLALPTSQSNYLYFPADTLQANTN